MWLANFEDGSSVTSKNHFWTQLPKDKRMSGIRLSHPYLPRLYLCLNNYDKYYFTQEAIGTMQGSQSISVIAEIIGAHDLKLGIAVEVRLSKTGNVNVRTYSLEVFKYAEEILHPGHRNGVPRCEVKEP